MPSKLKNELPPLDLAEEPIGKRIARLRKERGYTQRQLAKRIGILHTLVSDYERGRLRLYDEMVARFALALGVSTDIILGLRDNGHNVKPSLRIMRRVNKIESLSPSQQKMVLRAIDMFLKAAEE